VGERTQAERFAQSAFARASSPRQPLALIAAHRLMGELATDAGKRDDAEQHLHAALALADACAAPFERALTLLALAEHHIAQHHPGDARTLLNQVRSLCTLLGAKPTLARADALAARLSAIPPESVPAPAGLSAREVEVLRLIAAGKTNRDIATALCLSRHTVGIHVAHILAKTDSDNRAAATAFAVRHDLL
jgi:DNA-binding CsgD family transcriptional regulator